MRNRVILKSIMGAGFIIMPILVTGTESGGNAIIFSKEDWLGKMGAISPALLCKNFTGNEDINRKLIAAKIDTIKCLSLIPPIFDKCKTQYYSQIPDKIDDATSAKWGKMLGDCMGTNFAVSYLIPVSNVTSHGAEATPRDQWLSEVSSLGPSIMCAELFKNHSIQKRLRRFNISNENCLSILPGIINTCKTKYYSQIPVTLDEKTRDKWGKKIGRCVGKDFARHHLE